MFDNPYVDIYFSFQKSKRYLSELSHFMQIHREGKTVTSDKRFETFEGKCKEMKASIPELTAKLLLPDHPVKSLPHQMFYK